MNPIRFFCAIALYAASCAISAQTANPAPVPAPFKSDLEATSYAVGVDMVRNFKLQDVQFDEKQLMNGIRDASGKGTPLLSEAEVKRLVSTLENSVRSKMMAARKAEGETNQKLSDAYLKSNASLPGVNTLPNGVQYKVLHAGSGPKPTDDSAVVVNFKGMLVDGTVFDASPAGQPITVKPTQVIPGWKEALKMMPAGSKWELAVPANQAYGERGAGRVIGPNQALRFEVEVVEVRQP